MTGSPDAIVAEARALAARIGPPELRGADEGPRLDRAATLLLALGDAIPPAARAPVFRILWRLGFHDQARALGSVADLAADAARQGQPLVFLSLLARVETDADRRALLEAHRAWASGLEARAAADPIVRPARDPARREIRIGFLSSDLRNHVVAYFTQPVFEHQALGTELYVYASGLRVSDPARAWFESRSKAYRQLPPDDRAAAEVIAADQLDILIDLGGPTNANRPGVLAYRPSPVQASWLGYPHSLGLSTVDVLFGDRWVTPPDRSLLLETPALFESAWVCMAPAAFGPTPEPAREPPMRRKGHVTFGTANDPYKYSPACLRAWARVLAAVPDSRFLIIRPEAGAACFRENIARYFAEAGVAADRLEFRGVRGVVRPLYDEIDIALDTLPVTGGTTTCDALWMGVPTVSLIGPGFSERVSASILHHANFGGLVAETVDGYVALATQLAGVPDQLATLRRTARERIRGLTLGRPLNFAADFYGLVANVIAERSGTAWPS